jgi:sec-independent protein translocase protein TatA
MTLALPGIAGLGAPELILIVLVLVLLFGAKKLPELARGSGRALRIFKAETKGLIDDDDDDVPTTTTTTRTATVKPTEAIESPGAPAQPTNNTTQNGAEPRQPVIRDLQHPEDSR